jgi:hypothetical protein
MIHRAFLAPLLLALLLPEALPAQSATGIPGGTHQVGRIRVHYHLAGPHAVNPGDANHNGIPDQIEDLATQTRAAWLLFIDALGFPDPFQSPRFLKASFLDIHLRSKDTLKSNGVAYDELQHFNRPGDPPGTLSICFNVATSVQPSQNLTPAHELFHLIQNGACFFKNRWYTEGTARWSEKALGLGALGTGLHKPWPPPDTLLQQLDQMAYEAATQFWEPLILSRNTTDDLLPADRLPAELTALRYIDGSPVLKDRKLLGWQLIRDVLTELGRQDDLAYTERQLTRWSEEEQRSPLNTPHIHRAIETVTARSLNERPSSAPR